MRCDRVLISWNGGNRQNHDRAISATKCNERIESKPPLLARTPKPPALRLTEIVWNVLSIPSTVFGGFICNSARRDYSPETSKPEAIIVIAIIISWAFHLPGFIAEIPSRVESQGGTVSACDSRSSITSPSIATLLRYRMTADCHSPSLSQSHHGRSLLSACQQGT
jgi:hypothetical protein